MADTSKHTFVDSIDKVREMLNTLDDIPETDTSLFVDLEGIDLSRDGTISILQIYVLPQDHAYLVDVYTLQDSAFSTSADNGSTTVKSVLESSTIKKAFFDVRNDSDALFAHFGVRVDGVKDLQLMELATRSGSRRLVNGLAKCIDRDTLMSWAEKQEFDEVKGKGVRLFAPERGGRYEVFNDRPLTPELVAYCVQDVRILPKLFALYLSRITTSWIIKVEEATQARLMQSRGSTYNGKGRHMALAPAGWY